MVLKVLEVGRRSELETFGDEGKWPEHGAMIECDVEGAQALGKLLYRNVIVLPGVKVDTKDAATLLSEVAGALADDGRAVPPDAAEIPGLVRELVAYKRQATDRLERAHDEREAVSEQAQRTQHATEEHQSELLRVMREAIAGPGDVVDRLERLARELVDRAALPSTSPTAERGLRLLGVEVYELCDKARREAER